MSDRNIETIEGTGKSRRIKITNYQKPQGKGEIFPKMTQSGRIVGGVTREEAHKNPENIHGGVGIFLIDPENKEIYLPKRSPKKDKDPNCLDYSTGEHVSMKNADTGELETWEQVARRGINEELNLAPDVYKLIRIPGHVLDESDPSQTEWRTFYVALASKEKSITPDSEEIDESNSGWHNLSDLLEVVDGNPSENNALRNEKNPSHASK